MNLFFDCYSGHDTPERDKKKKKKREERKKKKKKRNGKQVTIGLG